VVVRPPRTTPDRSTRRPIQPVRPAESLRPGVGLWAAKARRRRYRGMLPPTIS